MFPPVKLLRAAPKRDRESDREEFRQTMELIASKCLEFGVEGTVDAYTPGPVVTTYEFKPSQGVKVSQVTSLENDLALALAAEKVRIERMAGRAAVGIEVPNRNRDLIALREVIESEKFRRSPSLLTIALGIDVHGEPVVADLARMPHLLVAGQTGAGKSVGVTGMITSILFKARPDEVKFIFVDPKMNDFKDYEDLPHLLVPVITDPKKAANALKWAVDEMEGRYKLLSEWPGVRNIEQYNAAIRDPRSLAEVREKIGDRLKADENGVIAPMPYIVIVIDELADLMMTAPREIEESVARLAQKARAVGVHLILATQRPSVDVITGTIKANLPCRVAYTTRTKIDSRTILDSMGAESLLGQGDMLYLAAGTSYLMRVHGGFISGEETREICRFLKKQGKPIYDETRDGGPRGPGGGQRAAVGLGRHGSDVRPGGAARRARAHGVHLVPAAPARDRLLPRRKAHRHDAARRNRGTARGREQEPRDPRPDGLLRGDRPQQKVLSWERSSGNAGAARGRGAKRVPIRRALLLAAEDRVLRGLRHAELHDALRRDLDRFAGRGVAAHARLAVHEHELAETGQRERVLRLLVGESGELLEKRRRGLLREARLLREGLRNLRFRHSSHLIPSFLQFAPESGCTHSRGKTRVSCRYTVAVQVVFFGSPSFALPSLEALRDAGHTLALVVSQPGKPVGRKGEVTDPPVAARAKSLGIQVFQPPTLKDDAAFARLSAAGADVFVVVAYGKILAPRVLDLPRLGCVNVHGSLLPRWRGASPVQAAHPRGRRGDGRLDHEDRRRDGHGAGLHDAGDEDRGGGIC